MHGNIVAHTGGGTPWSQCHELVEGIFGVQNNGDIQEELEIALESINADIFRGTISFLKAKHGFFGGCLGLSDYNYENFDGVSFGYKCCPVFIFKLIKAMNVLLPYQNFKFKYRQTIKEKGLVDMNSCKIQGLKPSHRQARAQGHQRSTEDHLDGHSRKIIIKGYE
jgi:hypothetical protein